MITVKRMKELLDCLPDDFRLYGYEGEDSGVGVMDASGDYVGFIRARDSEFEDRVLEGAVAAAAGAVGK